jgi:CRISPR/Cas system-associated protein Cas10 (large subunit of type III CRISPR-Cas system)
MTKINHLCENCGSRFSITYEESTCESDPTFCPMCAEMMFIDDDIEEDDSY